MKTLITFQLKIKLLPSHQITYWFNIMLRYKVRSSKSNGRTPSWIRIVILSILEIFIVFQISLFSTEPIELESGFAIAGVPSRIKMYRTSATCEIHSVLHFDRKKSHFAPSPGQFSLSKFPGSPHKIMTPWGVPRKFT